MAIKIVTDSTTEISQAEAKKLGITVVPLKSIFDGVEYLDGVDFTPEEFYEKLAAAKKLPTTSQPTPDDFEKAYRAVLDGGHQVIAVTLSGGISGTYQSAHIAKENCDEGIWVIDSGTATIGLQLLVKRALQLVGEGKSAQEIVDILEKEKQSIRLYAAVDTLEYLYKGGRLTRTAAFAGKLLKLKPIVSVLHGKLSAVCKCLGIKKAYRKLLELVEADGGVDFSKPFAIGYTGDRERFAEFEALCRQHFKDNTPIIGSVGAVIGTHAGPGAVAITFFAK
jgi:DegV family protein with EDD domain